MSLLRVFYYAFIAFCMLYHTTLFAGLPPYYYQIDDVAKQKEAFIKELKMLVNKGNEDILKEREFVTTFFEKATPDAFRGLNHQNIGQLIAIRNKYGVESLFDRNEYFKRIDKIPTSLVLAQAALESGWGKSRFAKEANNLFGHWTYSGVGLMPQNRAVGKTHMIRVFSSLQKSVSAYMLNLNTNEAYTLFRNNRQEAKNSGKRFGGMEASKTMINYSEQKEEYVKMIKEMIEQNNLLIYDN